MIRAISVAFSLTFLLAACDSQQQQNSFVEDANLTAKGFTSTDASGLVISQDDDDWRTAPVYFGKVRIDPVYPNPSSTEFVTVPVTVLEFNSVQGGLVLRARDNANRLRLLDEIDNASDPGAYIMRFSPAILSRFGLVRLFVFDRLGELVSYGDLQISGQSG